MDESAIWEKNSWPATGKLHEVKPSAMYLNCIFSQNCNDDILPLIPSIHDPVQYKKIARSPCRFCTVLANKSTIIFAYFTSSLCF